MLSGYPIIADAQAGLFYPGILPYVFLNGADASDLVALFHLIAAGVGTFGYLRALRLRPVAALVGRDRLHVQHRLRGLVDVG